MIKIFDSLWKLGTLLEAKTLYWFQYTKKRTEAEKNQDKDRKVLKKLTNNFVYEKTMEKLRNKIDVNLQATKKAI